jgi:hypothetical protein
VTFRITKHKLTRVLFIAVLTASVLPQLATAANSSKVDLSLISGQQDVFGDLVKDLGAAVNYKLVAPAEPLGILGFDVSLEVSGTSMESSALESATSGDAPGTLYIPKVHLHKGLPFGLDVGAFITSIPSSNIEVIGGELRYALMEGSTITPAISVRGTYSQMSGVDKFDLNTTGLELSISKGFLMLTPYAGIGAVRYQGDTSLVGLSQETINEKKYFLGLNFSLGLVNFAAETEQTGDNTTTSAKIGVRF